VNIPYEYVVAPYNDIEGTRALLAKHGEELFAVLLEPMQGSHGACRATSASQDGA